MNFKVNIKSSEWWFWTITLVFLMAAVAGWPAGYSAVILISFIQIPFIAFTSGSLFSFASQVRLVFFGLSLFGLWDGVNAYLYTTLIFGTGMVVLFSRCAISSVLEKMPWNGEVSSQ